MVPIAAFLPPHLVRTLARGGVRTPREDDFEAALLFSDISGFTALTEALQERGRAGAEEIALVVSRAFRPAIQAIERWGGSIVSFGGDALFAVFPDEAAVQRAVRSAEAIRQAFDRRGSIETSAGAVRLGISQAVHFGRVRGIHLGSSDRRHYLVSGPAVRALARIEARAGTAEIRLSPAARGRMAAEKRPRPRPRSRSATRQARLAAYIASVLRPVLGQFEGQYRTATVLFMETRIANLRALQRFFVDLETALDTYEGLLLKTDLSAFGTKWIAVFGVPSAHEDDPERAARAALAIRASAPRGAFRAGMHVGTLVNVEVGTRSRRSFDIMGDVVNTAARVVAQADWGEALATTACLSELPTIETRSKGSFAVKGKTEPLQIHEITGISEERKALRVAAPLVGRAEEMAELRGMLLDAREERGTTVGIRGDPGLGKSRLKLEVAKLAKAEGFRVFEGRTIPFGGMPYHAMGELLRAALDLGANAITQDVLARVRATSDALYLSTTDRHHLADVLGARYERSPLVHLDGKALRLNNMIAIRAFVRAIARSHPCLLVLEDMHWADELTWEAVSVLAQGIAGCRVALLLLYRPSHDPPPGAREIRLREISGDAVDDMLLALLGCAPGAVGRLVKERAEGNPLYVEEVVRHLREQGLLAFTGDGCELSREPSPEDLPGSLESLIAARLDHLSAAGRKLAQIASVVGRSFSVDLVKRMAGRGAPVENGLRDLESREIVFARSADARREYFFKHALTRDVAYGTILMARRRVLHRSAAEGIEALYPMERDAYLALLGHHWEHAGESARARSCYVAGARKAADAFAHDEAERLYRACLALEEEVTVETVSARTELGSRVLVTRGRHADAATLLGEALSQARRIDDRSSEAHCLRWLGTVRRITGQMEVSRQSYEEALAIWRQIGDRAQEGTILGDLAVWHMEQGRLEEAQDYYERSLGIHRASGDRRMEGVVLANLATLDQSRGRQENARSLFEEALGHFRAVRDRRNEGNALGNLAILYMEWGQLQEASDLYQMALAIQRELGIRRSEGVVLVNLALLHRTRGDLGLARTLFEQALAIQRETGDRRSEGASLGNLGVLLFDQGRGEEAEALLRQALGISREVGDRRFEGVWLRSLAFLLNEKGDPGSAKEAAAEAAGLFGQIGDERNEWIAKMELAIAALRSGSNDAPALAGLEAARVGLEAVGEKAELCRCVCWIGHARLAARRAARDLLEEAERLARALGVSGDGALRRTIDSLRRGVEAYEAGEPPDGPVGSSGVSHSGFTSGSFPGPPRRAP